MARTRSKNAVTLERGQFGDCSPSEIDRVEMARNLANQRGANAFDPVAPRRFFLNFGHAGRGERNAGGFQKPPQRVAVEKFFISPAAQERRGARVSNGAG